MRVTTTTSGLNSAMCRCYREKKASVSGVVGIPILQSATILRLVRSAMHDIAIQRRRYVKLLIKTHLSLQWNMFFTVSFETKAQYRFPCHYRSSFA